MFEASSFRIFGLEITQDDISKIYDVFIKTYKSLQERNPKWRNIDFCKTQLVALWENISSFLDEIIQNEKIKRVSSEYVKENLILNTENINFLTTLGRLSDGGLWLVSKFEKIRSERGSVYLHFNDRITKEELSAIIDLQKIRKELRRYASRVGNTLRQFVDWVHRHKKAIVTGCILVAGLVTITIFSGLWTGATAMSIAKLVIPPLIAIICLIAEAASTYSDLSDFLRNLKAYRGIDLRY